MDIKDFLDFHAERINNKDFIKDDPVQFPRRYNRLQDIEIVSFLVTTIAWGNRKMILRNSEKMLEKMGVSPYDYVMSGGFESLGTANVHRTFFEYNMAYMLRGFRQFYTSYDSMDAFMASCTDKSPQTLVAALRQAALDANGGIPDVRCYSSDLKNSALKRVNLALRWLVRDDGIVDLGVWKSLKKSQLYIPLDVHVGDIARETGLLTRRSNDWRAVEELTAQLRRFDPEDPIKYDFALFGIGVERK